MSRTYRFGRFNQVMRGWTGAQIREGIDGEFGFYMSFGKGEEYAMEKAVERYNQSCDWALKSLRDRQEGSWRKSFKTETKRRARRHTDAVLHEIAKEYAARDLGENRTSWDNALADYHHRPWADTPNLLVESAELHGYDRFSDIWAWY